MHYIIYRITNLINNKHYTGSHRTKDIDDGYLGSGRLITQAVKKYGKHNFKKEILFFAFDEASLNWAEEQLVVTKYQDPTSYNIEPGGNRPPKCDWTGKKHKESSKRLIGNGNSGKVRSEEFKETLRQIMMGNSYGKGHKQSKERIEQTRTRMIGNTNRKGIKHDEATILLLRELNTGEKNKMYGRTHSEEAKKSISESRSSAKWINDGLNEKTIHKNTGIPNGWMAGRTKKKWITNGIQNKQVSINYPIENDWRIGRTTNPK